MSQGRRTGPPHGGRGGGRLRRWARLWFRLAEPVDRGTYARHGFGLAAFKYAVDATAVGLFAAELPPPSSRVFRLGIAYPQRATIEGSGVGAVRRCEFSTGPFVEPITAWEAPSRLAFDVVAQPPPLEEWSPYRRLHPPHLDGWFRSRRGEFRLVRRPDGGTRLEGRTWYELDLRPRPYWRLWSDALVGAIHRRVLVEVRRRAEAAHAKAGRAAPAHATTRRTSPPPARGRP